MKRLRGLLIADPAVIVFTFCFGTLSLFVALLDNTGVKPTRLARVWAKCLLAACGVRVALDRIQTNREIIRELEQQEESDEETYAED